MYSQHSLKNLGTTGLQMASIRLMEDQKVLKNEDELEVLLGYIDHADWYEISGWGFDPATPDTALWLEVVVDDGKGVSFLANLHRQDLAEAGFGNGSFGFRLRFPTPLDPLAPHSVVVRRRDDARMLMNSPVLLARAPMASEAARAAFESAISAEIASLETGAELDATLTFLLRQVDKLLQGRADAIAGVDKLQRFRLRWSDHLPGDCAALPMVDQRPWVLVVDAELPETASASNVVLALQAMGYRVAVVATRDLRSDGATARSLALMGVTVLGNPEHFTVEDVLRRHRGLYRAVVLTGAPAASGYAVVARMHQPRARIVAALGNAAQDRGDPLLWLGAALLCDAVLVDTEEQATRFRSQFAGRTVLVLPFEALPEEIMTILDQSGVRAIDKVGSSGESEL
jgi:hypothetical protein